MPKVGTGQYRHFLNDLHVHNRYLELWEENEFLHVNDNGTVHLLRRLDEVPLPQYGLIVHLFTFTPHTPTKNEWAVEH